jgi:hypothetical protein
MERIEAKQTSPMVPTHLLGFHCFLLWSLIFPGWAPDIVSAERFQPITMEVRKSLVLAICSTIALKCCGVLSKANTWLLDSTAASLRHPLFQRNMDGTYVQVCTTVGQEWRYVQYSTYHTYVQYFAIFCVF